MAVLCLTSIFWCEWSLLIYHLFFTFSAGKGSEGNLHKDRLFRCKYGTEHQLSVTLCWLAFFWKKYEPRTVGVNDNPGFHFLENILNWLFLAEYLWGLGAVTTEWELEVYPRRSQGILKMTPFCKTYWLFLLPKTLNTSLSSHLCQGHLFRTTHFSLKLAIFIHLHHCNFILGHTSD
jgi:hypothetical protein